MDLLEEMKAELNEIWQEASSVQNIDEKSRLIDEYRALYQRYRRQIRFQKALNEPDKVTS